MRRGWRGLAKSAILLLSAMLAMSAADADILSDSVTGDMPRLLTLYRDLHSHPELSRQEKQTSARLAKEISGLGFKVTPGVGGDGIVAVLENGPGPVVMLRTDMDALPVREQTGLHEGWSGGIREFRLEERSPDGCPSRSGAPYA